MASIFISYRREDTSSWARLVYLALEEKYGRDEVFMDIDAIPAGADFVSEIERVIAESKVVVALVGRHWAVSEDGRKRLEDPKDFVRQEVAAALAAWRAKRTHLIPVLAPRSPVPNGEELPDDLRGFERINAVKLSDDYWNASIDALLSSVAGALEACVAPPPPVEIRPAGTRPAPPPQTDIAPPTRHFALLAGLIAHGEVSFFLGPGVNQAGRNEPDWRPGASFLPTSAELAAYVAETMHLHELLELGVKTEDLPAVAEYVETMLGEKSLYDLLRRVFAADYVPNGVHRALSGFPEVVRDRGGRGLLFVTLNQDDVLERALDARGEPYDVVSYIAVGTDRGKFRHYAPGGDVCVVEAPNEYVGVALDGRSVVLKLLGGIDRMDADYDSFVVSERDELEYASHGGTLSMVPVALKSSSETPICCSWGRARGGSWFASSSNRSSSGRSCSRRRGRFSRGPTCWNAACGRGGASSCTRPTSQSTWRSCSTPSPERKLDRHASVRGLVLSVAI